ncbi:hypothetical protein D3C76_1766670 [compost metagenome]
MSGCCCANDDNLGISHFAAKVGVTLTVRCDASGRNAWVALPIKAKALRISTL